MLRMYLLQIWFNLSDEGVEDAIYDSYAFRKFMNIDFMEEQAPDATTLLKFRHLLEENHLGEVFFKAINRVMEATGHIMHGGTIVDATIISAPSSTKNAEKKRDPEMYQTKKGNAWKFGMKCHIGVDSGSGLVHTITATAANAHDITEAHKLLREDDHVVYGDSVGILELRNGMRSKTTNIFVRSIFASIAVRKACRKYLIMRLTGNVILKTENPLYVAK